MPPDLFPSAADGGWQLVETHDLANGDAPDPVPRSAIERVRTASYKGPGDSQLEGHVYLLDSAQTAQVLATRWRPSADTVFFNKDRYFVVVRWQSGDRRALQTFVAQLQKHLGGAPRSR